MPRFTQQEILAAINDKNHRNFQSDRPVGHPVTVLAVGSAGAFPYVAVRPAPNTILEVRLVNAFTPAAASTPELYHSTQASITAVATPNVDDNFVYLQNPNPAGRARSFVMSGFFAAGLPDRIPIYLGQSYAAASPGPIQPPDPIVLFGDDRRNPALLIVANAVPYVTVMGREWPYDTDNY